MLRINCYKALLVVAFVLTLNIPNVGAMLTPWDDYSHPIFVAISNSLGQSEGHYRQKGATAEWSQLPNRTFRYDQWTDEYKVTYLSERMFMVVGIGGPDKWDDQVTFLIESAKTEYPNAPPPTREEAEDLFASIYVPTDQQARFVLNYMGLQNFKEYFGGPPSEIFPAWSLAYSGSSAKRELAMETLWEGYLMFQEGNANAVDIVEKALRIDPDLAYANIVRAQIAMSVSDWETAKEYFQIGLKHLWELDQIFSPFKEIIITAEELEAEARTFLGYTFIKLAQEANRVGKLSLEEKYLDSAKRNLQKSLTLSGDPELKEMAETLLRKFQY
jgi:tetratricopeptide (TPR) repeat protein